MTPTFFCTFQGQEITLNPVRFSSSAGELVDLLEALPAETVREFAEFSGPVLAAEVAAWDLEHVEDLIRIIEQCDMIMSYAGLETERYINMQNLPSVRPRPATLHGHPTWTMDRAGKIVAGPDAVEIEIYDSIEG